MVLPLPPRCPFAPSLPGVALLLILLLAFAAPAAAASLEELEIDLHGFVDLRHGTRLQEDPHQRDTTLSEARLQLEAFRMGQLATWQLRADLVHDEVPAGRDFDLEQGSGALDLREANALFTPVPFADVKVGRQILTWGTGDLLFINDLFPKDWQSFFIGRDVEYLKAPSDALLVSLFPAFANIDLAYTPRFDPDRFISGERLSYFNPMLGRRAGSDAVVDPETPDDWLEDDELALRLSKNLAGYETALYGYRGFWKSPVGFDPASDRATFPPLSVYGLSLRGPLGKAIANLETGYYLSRDDEDGDDPNVPNSEWRLLAGYERELARDFSAGLQYYLEYLQDYGAYKRSLPAGFPERDRRRQVVTLRLTRQLLSQTLTLSLFAYYSPSDEDGYLRPVVEYKATDALLLVAGANIFEGEEPHTFFGQFEKNSNLYAGIRYSF